MDVPEPPALRASDADRESAVDQLRTHCAAGRITPDELAERLGRVYESTTDVELRAVMADLPSQSKRSSITRRERTKRRLAHDAGRGGIAVGTCVGVWAVDGANGDFWPVWVLVFVAMRLAQDAWRLMGPAARLELDGPKAARALERRELERRALELYESRPERRHRHRRHRHR